MKLNQNGYVIPLTLIIFALIAAFLVIPRKFPKIKSVGIFGNGSNVTLPVQLRSNDKNQMQLEWFLFQR